MKRNIFPENFFFRNFAPAVARKSRARSRIARARSRIANSGRSRSASHVARPVWSGTGPVSSSSDQNRKLVRPNRGFRPTKPSSDQISSSSDQNAICLNHSNSVLIQYEQTSTAHACCYTHVLCPISLHVFCAAFRCLPVYTGYYVQYGEVSGDLTVSTYGVLIVHCLHRAALLGVPDLDLRGNRLQ